MKAKQKPGQTLEEVLHVDIQEDTFPQSETPNMKTNDVVYAVINRNEICTAYTDLTGRFPMQSSRGNQYILVGYHYDGNCILEKAIKDRKAGTLTATWQPLRNIFAKAGVAPNTYVMDNEISEELLKVLFPGITCPITQRSKPLDQDILVLFRPLPP